MFVTAYFNYCGTGTCVRYGQKKDDYYCCCANNNKGTFSLRNSQDMS